MAEEARLGALANQLDEAAALARAEVGRLQEADSRRNGQAARQDRVRLMRSETS